MKEEDDNIEDPYPLPTDLEEERTYLTSKNFMQHFTATFYEMTRELGISEVASAAKVEGPKIICKNEKIESDEAKESWQDFVPCIDVPFWPGKIIFDFLTIFIFVKIAAHPRSLNQRSILSLYNLLIFLKIALHFVYIFMIQLKVKDRKY